MGKAVSNPPSLHSRRDVLSYCAFLSFARRGDFVGQVGNLRPIGGALWARPSGITYKCLHSLRLAAMRGRLAICRPIVNRPPLWGGQSWLQPAFSRLFPPAYTSVSPARDCPAGVISRSCEPTSATLLTNPKASYTIVVSAPLRSDNLLDRPGPP